MRVAGVGWAIGEIGGIETGPGDVFIALALGHYLGEYFSDLEDALSGGGRSLDDILKDDDLAQRWVRASIRPS